MRAAPLLCLLALAGCARPHEPARPLAHAPPAPAGVKHRAATFEAADGEVLFEQCWSPSGRSPRAVVIIVHGIKDHSSRYAEMAVALARAGYAACGFDHRGHGRSAGARFDLHSFAAVLGDIDRYLGMARARFPDAPVFLFGHSMGGVLVPLYVIERQPAIAGVILSAPALHPPIHPIGIAGLLLSARLAPHAPLLNAPAESFSPDPEVVAGMRRDPLISQGKGTGRMGAELANGIRRVWSRVASLRAPILILSGTDDRAVDPRGSVELRRRVGSPDATLRLYRRAGHDLVHDPQRAAIVRDVLGWLDARQPPPIR
jgi:alpha-beta hydrolase superfamily lysophospholipase